MLSTKYLNSKKFTNRLKNIASWTIGRTVGCTSPAPPVKERRSLKRLQVSCRYSLTRFQNLYLLFSDESGWCWFIPFQGMTNLGIVQQQDLSNLKRYLLRSKLLETTTSQSWTEYHRSKLSWETRLLSTKTGPLLGLPATSATMPTYVGPNYRIVGDTPTRSSLLAYIWLRLVVCLPLRQSCR